MQHVFDKRYSTKYDVPTPGTPDRETWVAIAQSLMPLVNRSAARVSRGVFESMTLDRGS